MKKHITIPLLACVAFAAHCHGQGTTQITFDGPPTVAPGSAILTKEYEESGLVFQPITPPALGRTFVRRGSDPALGWPDNGTAYVQTSLTDTFSFRFTDGRLFDLVSVDLAEWSTVVPDAVTVRFVGYLPNGRILTRDITTDGIIDGTGPLADFQTFTFQGWDNLTRVEIPTLGWSLDNLTLNVVPEPGSGTLILAGGLVLWVARRRSGAQAPS